MFGDGESGPRGVEFGSGLDLSSAIPAYTAGSISPRRVRFECIIGPPTLGRCGLFRTDSDREAVPLQRSPALLPCFRRVGEVEGSGVQSGGDGGAQ